VTTTADPVAPVSVNLGRREIAAYLHVSLTIVDRLVRTNAFPSFKIGKLRLARLEDVKRFNDSLARAAAGAVGDVSAALAGAASSLEAATRARGG